mmetsp:Transcript_6261/g.15556  ORF Transcript_6261/g.15556 Transcript_6261/m.15556 type:complete len:192 (+) Transcript_6261:131-706(+)
MRAIAARLLRAAAAQCDVGAQMPAPRPVSLLRRIDEEQERPAARVLDWPRGFPAALGAHVALSIRESTIAGRGVFAREAVTAGSLVEVAPVLVLRKDDVAASSEGLRYFFQAPDGDSLLCVLGFGMLYNHGGPGANLRYEVRRAPGQGGRAPDAGICVAFEAVRDLGAGEELLIDYSDAWWQQKGLTPTSV